MVAVTQCDAGISFLLTVIAASANRYGLVSGNVWLTLPGGAFIAAVGGDILILWLLRGVEKTALVEDHPHASGVLCTARTGERWIEAMSYIC